MNLTDLILELIPKLNKIELTDFNLNSQETDANLSFPALENLRDVRINNRQDHRVAEVLKHSKNLQKIDVKVHSIEDSLIHFVKRQKLLKILIFYSNKFPLVEHVDFQLNSLRTQVFIDVGDNVMNTKGGYSSAVCEDFLKFILTQNQLEDVRITIEMKSFSEYQRYFDHILSLETLKSFNVDSNDECANYFKTTEIVNEHVENLKVWQHRKSRNNSLIKGRIAMIFPNTENLNFSTDFKLRNRSEIIIQVQGSLITLRSEDKSPLDDSLLQISSLKNLRELTIELETPSQLRFLQFNALEVFNVHFYEFHEHCGSFKNFFDNNPSLKSLEIKIQRLNDVIYSKEYNELFNELIEMIPQQRSLERFVMSQDEFSVRQVNTEYLFEKFRHSKSLKYVCLFGTDESY